MNDSLATSYPSAVEPFGRARVAPVADADRRRPIVVVLGMHRSGTSLCAHILSAMGIDMADAIGEHPSNTRGHWERWEIVEFHDRILGLFNRDYYGPFHDFSLPVAWWVDPRVFAIKREIVAFLERRMGDGYFGFKDPRTVRLMPVWHQIFNDLKLAPKIVLCLRDPTQVARSVKARDGLDLEIGEYRWLTHMVDFFRYSGDFDICTVEYERWFTDPFGNFEQLKKFLDVPWQQSKADLGLVLSGIVDPALRHDSSDHREAGQPLVRSLYALARDDHPDGGARHQTSDIITQHINFQKLHEPFQRVFENIAGIAAKLPQVEQGAADLRAAVGERDALIEAANGRASAAEERLAEAVAAAEAQRVHFAEIALERDAHAAALEKARAELASSQLREDLARAENEATALRTALNEREAAAQEADVRANASEARLAALLSEVEAQRLQITAISGDLSDRDTAATALRAEIETLRSALDQAEQRGQEHAVAAATAQAESAVLRDGLACAELESVEASAVAAAICAEITSSRVALTHAQQEAQDRTAPGEALQAEINSLRSALAAVERRRHEGEAVTAALRGDITKLHQALADAEQHRQQPEAATAALQAQVTSLHGELAVAREIGRAALASLQIEPATAPEVPRKTGWLALVRRPFRFHARLPSPWAE
jgi:Sulfotransferase family